MLHDFPTCFSLKVRCSKLVYVLLPYVVQPTKLLCYHYSLPNIFLKKSFLSNIFFKDHGVYFFYIIHGVWHRLWVVVEIEMQGIME